MFNKATQIIAKTFSAKWNIRPTLAGVYFKNDIIAATNSFKLIEVKIREYQKKVMFTQSNFEILEQNDIDFIIPNETILGIKFPNNRNYPVLKNAYFWDIIREKDNSIKSVWIITNNLDQETITHTRVIKWKFPNYESFFENDKNIVFWLSVNELLETCKAFKDLWHTQMKFTIWTPLQPIKIEWNDTEEFQTKAIIMPLKLS